MKILVSVFAFILSLNLFAAEVPELVKEYRSLEWNQFLLNDSQDKHDDCYPMPDRSSCVKYACSTVRTFQCDDQTEVQRVFEACRGNYGDQCLKKAISFLRNFEYDDLNEMEELAVGCRGVFDTGCVDFVCQRLGSFKCDDRQEIIAVLNQCKY